MQRCPLPDVYATLLTVPAPREAMDTELPEFLQPAGAFEPDPRFEDPLGSYRPEDEAAPSPIDQPGAFERHGALRSHQRPRSLQAQRDTVLSDGTGVYEELEDPAAASSIDRDSVRNQFEIPYVPGHEPEEVKRLRREEEEAMAQDQRLMVRGPDGKDHLRVAYLQRPRSRYGSQQRLPSAGSTHSLPRPHRVELKVPRGSGTIDRRSFPREGDAAIVPERSAGVSAAPGSGPKSDLVEGALNFMMSVLDGKIPAGMKEEPAQRNPFAIGPQEQPEPQDADEAQERSIQPKLTVSQLKAGRRSHSLGRLSRSRNSLFGSKSRLRAESSSSMKQAGVGESRPADRWPSMPLPPPEKYNSLWLLSPDREGQLTRRKGNRDWPTVQTNYNYVTGL